jgi:hypothetical protein
LVWLLLSLGSSFWLVVVLELSLDWVRRNTNTGSSVIRKDVRRPVGHQHVDAPAAGFFFFFSFTVFVAKTTQ